MILVYTFNIKKTNNVIVTEFYFLERFYCKISHVTGTKMTKQL